MIINKLNKIYFSVFLILLTSSCTSNIELNCSDLIEENGLVKLNDKNFSGSCLTYYDANLTMLDEKDPIKMV